MQLAIEFGFPSHWLINWREIFQPITKRSNRNHVITFDSHLKTALCSRKRIALSFLFLSFLCLSLPQGEIRYGRTKRHTDGCTQLLHTGQIIIAVIIIIIHTYIRSDWEVSIIADHLMINNNNRLLTDES